MIIAMACTGNWYHYLTVDIFSLLKTTKTVKKIYLLLETDNIDDLDELKKVIEKYPVEIKLINFNNIFDDLVEKGNINRDTIFSNFCFARLALPSVVEEDKILYIDTDAIVIQDISKVWRVNIDDYYLAGCKDYGIIRDGTNEKLGFTGRYVNSGYILMNLKKIREDNLIRIAMTDELTMMGNRRGYDEEVRTYFEDVLPYDLVIYSVDVNGLKMVNDTRGHSAGDKLIRKAARFLSETFGDMGKVFRIGGDEFIAIVNTKTPRMILDTIKDKASSLEVFPEYTLSISVGYAAVADFPNLDIKGLEKNADNMMYEDKEAYYKRMGIDRRRK